MTESPPTEADSEDVGAVIRRWSLAELMQQAHLIEGQAGKAAATALYFHWLQDESKPNRHIAYFNMGVLQAAQGQTAQALATYEQCVRVAPAFGQGYINAGLCHERLGDAEQAIDTWSRLIVRATTGDAVPMDMQTAAFNHIGRLREARREYEQAEAALRQSLQLDPKQPGVIQHWVHIRQKGCQWPVHQPMGELSEGDLWQATSPLAMLALTERPEQSLASAQAFVARTYGTQQEHLCKGRTYAHHKVRVGYVSGDLREHAVGFLMSSIIDSHDRSRYEIYAYDFSKHESSAIRQRLLSSFDHVRSIHDMSDREAAQAVLEDEIDVLIDMHGLSAGARPGIFSLRPAPHQGTYLGFIGPTGMPWLDFVIADEQVLPPALAKHFTERPIYVKGSFMPWTSDDRTAEPAQRAAFDLPEDAFVMGGFGNVYKITPELLSSWLRLLKRIPNAYLMLLDDNPMTTRALNEHAESAGADMARIRFVPRTTHAEFGANLKLLDVYLDTYPYNCGSTTIDVVKAGVPMVTRYGETMVSRMGLSVLTNIDAADNAVTTQQAYEERVVKLALRAKAGRPYRYKKSRTTIDMDHALAQLNVRSVSPALAQLLATPAEFSKVGVRSPRIEIHHLAYDDETMAQVPEGFIPLDNRANERPDWREYWPIRNYLLENTLEDGVLYGFFSPRFSQKAGIPVEDLHDYVKAYAQDCDVVAFSPYWDFNALFKSPFHQGDFFHRGLMENMQTLADQARLGLDLNQVVMHSENTVFCNYFLATKAFWSEWLELGELYFHHAESLRDDEGALVNKPVKHRDGELPMKIFVQERLVDLLLATGRYRSSAYDIFALHASATPLNGYFSEAVQGNALKLAYTQTGKIRYLQSYEALMKTVMS